MQGSPYLEIAEIEIADQDATEPVLVCLETGPHGRLVINDMTAVDPVAIKPVRQLGSKRIRRRAAPDRRVNPRQENARYLFDPVFRHHVQCCGTERRRPLTLPNKRIGAELRVSFPAQLQAADFFVVTVNVLSGEARIEPPGELANMFMDGFLSALVVQENHVGHPDRGANQRRWPGVNLVDQFRSQWVRRQAAKQRTIPLAVGWARANLIILLCHYRYLEPLTGFHCIPHDPDCLSCFCEPTAPANRMVRDRLADRSRKKQPSFSSLGRGRLTGNWPGVLRVCSWLAMRHRKSITDLPSSSG